MPRGARSGRPADRPGALCSPLEGFPQVRRGPCHARGRRHPWRRPLVPPNPHARPQRRDPQTAAAGSGGRRRSLGSPTTVGSARREHCPGTPLRDRQEGDSLAYGQVPSAPATRDRTCKGGSVGAVAVSPGRPDPGRRTTARGARPARAREPRDPLPAARAASTSPGGRAVSQYSPAYDRPGAATEACRNRGRTSRTGAGHQRCQPPLRRRPRRRRPAGARARMRHRPADDRCDRTRW